MRKTVWFTCAAAICALTAGAATQTPDPSQKAKGKTVTVTGCVERAAETGTAGTAGTTGTSAMAAKFELTNAEITRGSSSEATGTSGMSAAVKTYRLDGTDTQLAAHLNHKVEVTGTLEEEASTGTPGTAGTTGSAKPAAPRLKVESVKMVSATCRE